MAQGGLRVPWPWGWTCSSPFITTSSQKTNVSSCQLPEPSVPNRKSSAPSGEVPFQALVQLPAHGGQNQAVTPAPDPARSCWASTGTAWLPCLCRVCAVSVPCLSCSSRAGICLSHLSAPRFPPSPSVVCSWQRGGAVGPSPGEAARLRMRTQRGREMLVINVMK